MSRAESHEVGGEGSEAGFSGGEDGGRASQENGEAGSDGLSLRGIVVTFVTLSRSLPNCGQENKYNRSFWCDTMYATRANTCTVQMRERNHI